MRNRCEEGVISKYSGDRSKSIVEFLLRIAIHRWKQRFSIVFPAGRIASLKVATISRSVTSDSRPGDNVPDVFNFRPSGKLSREGTSTTTTTMQRRPLPSVAIHHRYRDSSTFYKSSIQTSSLGRKKFKEEEDTRNFYFSLPKPASPPPPPPPPSWNRIFRNFFSLRTLLLPRNTRGRTNWKWAKIAIFRGGGILRGDR